VAVAKAVPGESGRVVDHVFWLTPGHASEKDVWYAGTSTCSNGVTVSY
jgi:hypothetical protein